MKKIKEPGALRKRMLPSFISLALIPKQELSLEKAYNIPCITDFIHDFCMQAVKGMI